MQRDRDTATRGPDSDGGDPPTWPPDYTPQHYRDAFAGCVGLNWTEAAKRTAAHGITTDIDKVWVHKRHHPDDPRAIFPATAVKPMADQHAAPQPVPSYWVQTPESHVGTYSRADEEDKIYRSSPATRAEEWSTLRAMQPSQGFPKRHLQERWGVSGTDPPEHVQSNQKAHPHYNSSSTQYVDDVFVNNKHVRASNMRHCSRT